jgi:hypothetical protein
VLKGGHEIEFVARSLDSGQELARGESRFIAPP